MLLGEWEQFHARTTHLSLSWPVVYRLGIFSGATRCTLSSGAVKLDRPCPPFCCPPPPLAVHRFPRRALAEFRYLRIGGREVCWPSIPLAGAPCVIWATNGSLPQKADGSSSETEVNVHLLRRPEHAISLVSYIVTGFSLDDVVTLARNKVILREAHGEYCLLHTFTMSLNFILFHAVACILQCRPP